MSGSRLEYATADEDRRGLSPAYIAAMRSLVQTLALGTTPCDGCRCDVRVHPERRASIVTRSLSGDPRVLCGTCAGYARVDRMIEQQKAEMRRRGRR